jgi:hypothetical protein
MKCNVYGALMILVLALIVSAPMAQAQAGAKAQVPFDFNLEQKLMPAGAYEVGSLNTNVLAVRNLDTREGRLLIKPMHKQASQAAGIPHAKLVFRKYGEQYFLAEIWDGQSTIGIAFPESKREKELQTASSFAPQPEVVVLAMK